MAEYNHLPYFMVPSWYHHLTDITASAITYQISSDLRLSKLPVKLCHCSCWAYTLTIYCGYGRNLKLRWSVWRICELLLESVDLFSPGNQIIPHLTHVPELNTWKECTKLMSGRAKKKLFLISTPCYQVSTQPDKVSL